MDRFAEKDARQARRRAAPLLSLGNWAKPAATDETFRRSEMADHAEVEYATANGNDYAEHEKTYKFFLNLAKYGTAGIIVILILMAYFLV